MSKLQRPRKPTLAILLTLSFLLSAACRTIEIRFEPGLQPDPGDDPTLAALVAERDRLATQVATLQAASARLNLLASYEDLAAVTLTDGVGYALSSDLRNLLTLDFSNPTEPEEIGRSERLPADVLNLIHPGGRVVYAQTAEELFVLSADNLGTPEVLSTLPYPFVGGYGLTHGLLHLAGPRGVHVLDVSDPANPVEVLTYSVPGGAEQIFIDNGIAYITASQLGLRIFDVSYPEAHIEIGAYVTGRDWFAGVFVRDNVAYVTTITGLRILDVSDPSNPIELQRYPAPFAGGIIVEGPYAFLSWEGGIHVLDVTEPAAPRLVAAYEDPFGFGPVTVLGEYVIESGRFVRVYRFVPPGG